MKATYRAKFNALRAMNDGYSLITIRRRNETVAVWLDDIIDTPNGEKVQEYGEPNKYCLKDNACMTFRDLINY